MTLAAGLVLIAAVFVVVGWPFFRRPSARPAEVASSESLDRFERQKQEAYGAIRDAEQDLQTGKMSQVDFEFIRDKYTARALEAIAALEQARSRHPVAAPGGVRFLFCPECGRKLPGRARFCPGCGRALRADDDAA
jgi:hypothetical protein